jgi:hypothetical protein
VTDCKGNAELISCYVDGELSEEENKSLVKHINSCPACAALLGLYQEMSETLSDQPEAPATLLTGVMDEIKALTLAGAAFDGHAAVKAHVRRRTWKPVYSVFAAAACLAVILFASPLKAMFFSYSTEAPSSSAVADMMFGGLEGQNELHLMEPGMSLAQGKLDESDSGTMSAKGAVDATQPVAPDAMPPDTAVSSDSYYYAADASNSAARATDNSGIKEASPEPLPEPGYSEEGQVGIMLAPQPTEPDLNAYYAILTIKGALPDALKDNKMAEQSDGTYRIEISAETAKQLIEDGYSYETGNSEAENALVIYIA